jgi:hypothetical protein
LDYLNSWPIKRIAIVSANVSWFLEQGYKRLQTAYIGNPNLEKTNAGRIPLFKTITATETIK